MASEHDPHSNTARSGQGDATTLDNAVSAGNLAANTDLHVIYKESCGLAITQICELYWDGQTVCILHGLVLRGTMDSAAHRPIERFADVNRRVKQELER